jgi:uncharacterized protein involved in response to NO
LPNKTKLILVLTVATTFYLFLAAIAFRSQSLDHFWKSPSVIVVILILSVAPIYPLYRVLKQRDRFSALAMMLLICALLCGLLYFAGSLILPANALGLSVAAMLIKILIPTACVLFIWNGFMRRKKK